MGNCFSDPSKPPGEGQVLGTAPPQKQNTPAAQSNASAPAARQAAPPRTLGSANGAVDSDADMNARERALRAAEERAKASQKKGVNASNPKAGQLSSKLAANTTSVSQQQGNERMMDRGDWN